MLSFSLKPKEFFISILSSIFLFFLLSLFLSFQKLYIVGIISIFFIFLNINYKKIIILNLVILVIFLKIIFSLYSPKDYYSVLSKTIYEKHFLVGVKNLNLNTPIFGGNMDPNNKKNIRTVNIETDKLGFRNSIEVNKADYILIGDSLFHNHRIDQPNLINTRLNNKSSIKFYNASLTGADMGNYFETIKYFKTYNEDKKFIMTIFPGNDFLNYKTIQKNHSRNLSNSFLKNYFEIKEFFDFYTRIKFITNLFKKKKLDERIDKKQIINGKNIYFYKRYYVKPNVEINFSKAFDIYKEFSPDILIIVPSKAQVYCKFLESYDCDNLNYKEKLENISLFKNSEILDSTSYLRKVAQQKLLSNKFIFFVDDTHLNEEGLDIFSDFILDKLN